MQTIPEMLFDLDQAILSAKMRGFNGTAEALEAVKAALTAHLDGPLLGDWRHRPGSPDTPRHLRREGWKHDEVSHER